MKPTNCIEQAITTRFLGATNTRGSRIKAYAYAGSVTVDYSHVLNSYENHAVAASALVEKLGWPNEGWVQGCLPDGDGYAFVRNA